MNTIWESDKGFSHHAAGPSWRLSCLIWQANAPLPARNVCLDVNGMVWYGWYGWYGMVWQSYRHHRATRSAASSATESDCCACRRMNDEAFHVSMILQACINSSSRPVIVLINKGADRRKYEYRSTQVTPQLPRVPSWKMVARGCCNGTSHSPRLQQHVLGMTALFCPVKVVIPSADHSTTSPLGVVCASCCRSAAVKLGICFAHRRFPVPVPDS